MTRKLLHLAQRFWEAEDGATATEYAVMLALIILVCMTAVSALGEKVSGSFTEAENQFSQYYP